MAPCSRRRQARKSDIILDSCFQLGRGAEYVIARGSGRQLSYEEALDIMAEAEEDGTAVVRATEELKAPRANGAANTAVG